MWEICKTQPDAEKEVDRTIAVIVFHISLICFQYILDTIKELKGLQNRESTFTSDSGVFAQIRRAPLGKRNRLIFCLIFK